MSECNRKTCKLSGESIPELGDGEPSPPPLQGHWFVTQRVVKKTVRWDGTNVDEMADFAGDHAKVKAEGERKSLVIEMLEGTMLGEPGDWIIRGVNGEFYPCKPDIFAKTYEPLESGAAQEVSPPATGTTSDPRTGYLSQGGDTRELKAALSNLVARLKIVMAWPEPHFSQDLPIEIRAELAEAEKLLG